MGKEGTQEGVVSSFVKLTDTPASYSGQSGKIPFVNTDESALVFRPLFSTNPSDADILYEDGWVKLCMRRNVTNKWPVCKAYHHSGYGTYEWKAQLSQVVTNLTCWIGGLQEEGLDTRNCVMAYVNDGVYLFITAGGTASTTTTLAGQDWTVEHTFKIIWSATEAYLYVDGVEVAHHTTNIPTNQNLVKFFEFNHKAALSENTWVKTKGLITEETL